MEEQIEESLEEESDFAESRMSVPPCIFEGIVQDPLPVGFNAVTIFLDGQVRADLNWKQAREQAQQAVQQGYALMWNIDLGLFDRLMQPLTSQTQFLSLALSLEHFRDSLWQEFKSQTLGLSFFRGSADFSQNFPWDNHQKHNFQEWKQEVGCSHLGAWDELSLSQRCEERRFTQLFCRDVALEYLSLLAARLPDSLRTYIYLDALSLADFPLNQLQILNPERFDRLRLALKGSSLPFNAWGWQTPSYQGYSGVISADLPLVPKISIGLCVPPLGFYHSSHYQGFEEGIKCLKERHLDFKLIAEHQLTSQWDELDYLLYTPAGLSSQGRRKLQGFCAAGGTVISTGDYLLGFPHEMSLAQWVEILSS